ncbi:hypothetical protein EXU48_23785 [Occultella glacieicola]|uniref:Uncharacterized protein n=1 Tax=Occultella glacieicola TaxID=2518684 RepID=A0ABY2DWR8_9MICO|nr:hypothetical protein [Occultella glacieicola]TDE88147.1 hypothetical protein EXU48_23785 [Occultella glacieicola]
MSPIFDQASGDDWKQNAVADRYHETDSKLAEGYKRAAELVVAAWPEERFDALLPPVILLYRHAMELQLKTAIGVAERAKPYANLTSRTSDDLAKWFKNTAGHRLGVLRDELNHSLVALGAQAMDSSVVGVIDELDQADDRGETFRYSWTLQKDPSGAWGKVQTPRPGQTSGGRVNIVEMGQALSEAVNHIGAIWSQLEAERVDPFEQ